MSELNAAPILLAAAGVVGVLVGAAIAAVVVLLYRTERLVKRVACRGALKFDRGAERAPSPKV
ncbi:MAG TPA: hypothetical protein VKZ18_02870 [Polyangia bacterium]|nr:hypothetical protein [Polyangia bacterium]